MHLLGLDYYNRPQQTIQDRYDLIASNYRKTVIARMCRILPAFGFGGIGNKVFRENFHDVINRATATLAISNPAATLNGAMKVTASSIKR